MEIKSKYPVGQSLPDKNLDFNIKEGCDLYMFFKTEGSKIIFNGDGELIYYVPEKYFEIKAAETVGERTEVMGIFMYAVFDKNGKRIAYKPFNCPTMIECIPNDMTKESNYLLDGTKTPKDYRLLHFKNGDELICSIDLPVDFAVLEKFVDIFKSGNLPEYIPYDEVQNYILKNADLCKFDYKVSAQVMGMIISKIYRSDKDLSKPFRTVATDDMLAYKTISIEKVPKYTSPFASITSDNADEAIAAALTMTNNEESPLEKIMMA